MKKFITILTLCLMALPAVFAQKVSSNSRSITILHEEKPKSLVESCWAFKLGGGINTNNRGTTDGIYNISIGYHKVLNNDGIYLGAELGSTMYTTEDYWDSSTDPGIYIGPVLGIKRPFGGYKIFDFHIGVNYNYNFGEDINNLAGQAGIGVWFGKYLVEIQYSPMNLLEQTFCNQIGLNLGIRF